MVGQLNIIKLLLDHGADPNLADSSTITPAETAIRHNQDDSLKLLLLYGASVDKPNLLHYLVQNSRFQTKRWDKKIRMVKLLWSFGAKINEKNKAGLNIFDVMNDEHFPRIASHALTPILQKLLTKPMSLKAASRLQIKRNISAKQYIAGIQSLQPLPRQVIAYLHHTSE